MNRVLMILALLSSLVLVVLPRIFPICTGLMNGNPMHCHYAYQAEFLFAILAVILAGFLFVLKTSEARALTGLLLSFIAIIIIVLPQPWAIGICTQGSCLKTAYFSTLIAALLAIIGIFIVFKNFRERDYEIKE